MSENKHHHHHPDEGPHPPTDNEYSIPYWKRAHRDWRFWVGVCCIIVAIAVYVGSVDLSLVPRIQPQPHSNAVTP
jgi:hypothetical protein